MYENVCVIICYNIHACKNACMHVYQYIKYECLCTVYMMGVCACNTYLLSMLLCNAYTSVCVCVHMKVHLIFKQMFREYTCTTKCNTLSGDPYLVGD